MTGPLLASAQPRRVRANTPREYAVRFFVGGLLTVAAGLIAMQWGPVVGGLFLAFPSILPASLTLVAKHSGLTRAAGADGVGAALGSLGLLGFAFLVWTVGTHLPAWLVLALASVIWLVIAVAAWATFQVWHLRRHVVRALQWRRPT